MKKIVMAGLTAAALTSGAYAGCSGTVCDQVKINEVVATAWGSITVDTNADETALSCTPYGNKYVYVAANAAGKNAIYSALLTAKTTGKAVRINLAADSNGKCQIQYVNIK